jgi:Vitamin K-dependent gamma-carboxylase
VGETEGGVAVSEPQFVGVQPRFPGFVQRWRWLNEAVPAERVAAVRIAVALSLLLDLFCGILPHFGTLYFPDALGGRDISPWRFRDGHFYWSILRVLPENWGPTALFSVWVLAAFALLVGYRPLITGLACWACAVSFCNIHPATCNGGDRLRNVLLLLVAVSRSGAVWGIQSVRKDREPVYVPGWPVKVLIVQLACVYFFTGVYKIASPQWRSGFVMYFVNHDLTWSLAPDLTSRLPIALHRLTSWITIAWELAFPLLIALRGTRAAALLLGVVFHLVTFFTLEVGHFGLYSLAFYPVFVPWERWRSRDPKRSALSEGTLNRRE